MARTLAQTASSSSKTAPTQQIVTEEGESTTRTTWTSWR